MERTKDGFENGRHFKGLSIGYSRANQCLVRGYISERICYNQLIRLDIHRIIEGAEIRGKGTQVI